MYIRPALQEIPQNRGDLSVRCEVRGASTRYAVAFGSLDILLHCIRGALSAAILFSIKDVSVS